VHARREVSGPTWPLSVSLRHSPDDEVWLFTATWPGPGNSEGPVDPEPTIGSSAIRSAVRGSGPGMGMLQLIMTDPWPGPGDSEGPGHDEPEAAPAESPRPGERLPDLRISEPALRLSGMPVSRLRGPKH
jgi:hypothetical protein